MLDNPNRGDHEVIQKPTHSSMFRCYTGQAMTDRDSLLTLLTFSASHYSILA
jgi:hypothetical protein